MMVQPRNNRTLLLLIMVLLLTNGVMLYLLTRPEPAKEPEMTRTERSIKMVQEELGLSPAQAEQYIRLRAYRDSLMMPHQYALRAAKADLMQLLHRDSVSQTTLDSAVERVGDLQEPIEREYFNHFRRMQQMLDSSQKLRFDTLLQRMVIRTTGSADSLQRATASPSR